MTGGLPNPLFHTGNSNSTQLLLILHGTFALIFRVHVYKKRS
jgi:hypothetical protein